MKSLQKISLILSFFMLSSCYESLDFNQVENYVHKPIVTSALTYFKVLPFQFFDTSNVQQSQIQDVTDFKIFETNYIKDNLARIDFNVEIKNEFDREVTFNVEFLNNSNNVVYTFTPIVVQSNDLDFMYLETILIASNQNVLNAGKVRITAILENTGVALNPSDTSEFEFKSSVTLYIESEI